MNHAWNTVVIEHLAEQGHLTSEQAQHYVHAEVPSSGSPLKNLLIGGAVPEQAFANTLSALLNTEIVSPTEFPRTSLPETDVLSDFLLQHEALPIARQDDCLSVAMTDPSDDFVTKVLRAKLDCRIKPLVALRSQLLPAINRRYSAQASVTVEANALNAVTPIEQHQSTLIRDIDRLIQQAVIMGASDIHFEPSHNLTRVRFRISGMLRDIRTFSTEDTPQLVARLKLMARLDVTERRHAQNGRLKFPADGRLIDLRLSTLPLLNGESIVLRLLEASLSQSSLDALGFRPSIESSLLQAISNQQGMILITGPTGSGKTTTLYSLLHQLNRPELKLVSVEDPVELNIDGINQIQVDDDYGVTFSQALKSVLRQDPDVIMIGEIRDSATAQLAAQAALTGHLVLSTLHTATAASAITRLRNLGLADYLIASTLKAVLAQRLVRCLCQHCGNAPANDCQACQGDGYRGRTAIAELLTLPSRLEQQLDESALVSNLVDNVCLQQAAEQLVKDGVTNQAEIVRILGTTGASDA